MIDLIMLGRVPGTSIQITFWAWILLAAFVLGIATIWHRKRIERRIWSGILALNVLVVSRRQLKQLDQIAL